MTMMVERASEHEAWLNEAVEAIPFLQHLGAKLVRCGGGEAELHFDVQAHHSNSWRVAHGGLVMTLLDSAMGLAAQSPGSGRSPGMATIQMTSMFIRGATGRLVVNARVVHQSLTLAFCEASATDGPGGLYAQGSATFKRLSIANVECPVAP